MPFTSYGPVISFPYPIARTCKLLYDCILLLNFVVPTLQVDITMVDRYGTIQRCANVPPGVCCSLAPRRRNVPAEDVFFRRLEAFDVAAAWQRAFRNDPTSAGSMTAFYDGCSGVPWQTRWGPGNWRVGTMDQNNNEVDWRSSSGASYVRLPLSLPPDPRTVDWLQLQGMRGLVWGGGHWFARVGAAAGSGVLPRSKIRKRGIRSPNKGIAYLTQPPRWIYPTSIFENGTEYVRDMAQNMTYRSASGEVLDMTGVP